MNVEGCKIKGMYVVMDTVSPQLKPRGLINSIITWVQIETESIESIDLDR